MVISVLHYMKVKCDLLCQKNVFFSMQKSCFIIFYSKLAPHQLAIWDMRVKHNNLMHQMHVNKCHHVC